MEDMTSQLPDNILISIILSIPTKDAIRTSILSRRWRNLTRFLPAFDFSCRCQYVSTCPSKAISNGVHGFLQRHYASLPFFKLCCCLAESHTHDTFEQCISSLGKLGIEKLILQLSCKNLAPEFSFSCHLLSQMPSLQYFTLRYCSLQPNLQYSCNSLKMLKLSKVKGPPGSLECILSNCLSLCSLTLKRCDFPSKLCFRGPNLKLKCLSIHDCDGLTEIEFYASNLMIFELYSIHMVNLIFEYVPQLQSIYLSAIFEEVMPYVCRRLVNELPHLKTLLLDNIEEFFEQGGSTDMGINMFKFNNLKRLDLGMFHVYTFNLFDLTPLLHSCPLLEEFHLSADAAYYNWADEGKHVVFHSHLKNVELNGFSGTKEEIAFASYILKSAINLRLMNMSWYCCWYAGFGEWEVDDAPSSGGGAFCKVDESIQQLEHQAVSKAAQLIFQQFPQTVPKQF
ncbi:hypothetical protein OROHE_003215 [Orobanche hederae]